MPPLASLWQMKLQNDSHKRSQNIHGIGCNFGNRSCVDRSAVHLALADTTTTTITKTTTGVNVQTDTNQKQNCETAGGSSPI